VNGFTDTCKFLLEKGSDINEKDKDGKIPIHKGDYLLNN
jgi:hypothetical protein